jgi:hypothetical protein
MERHIRGAYIKSAGGAATGRGRFSRLFPPRGASGSVQPLIQRTRLTEPTPYQLVPSHMHILAALLKASRPYTASQVLKGGTAFKAADLGAAP